MESLQDQLINTIRDVPDFPKPGIVFKDITPVLSNPNLSKQVSRAFAEYWDGRGLDGVVGIESRGFIFGMQLAQELGVSFIPIRKKGKLPFHTVSHSYELEYGKAEIELHTDSIRAGQKILIHDDLLATGGTAKASAHLVERLGGKIAGYSFLVELSFLAGEKELGESEVHSLVKF